MRWYYKLIEETPAYYKYAYSRESKEYDGEIIFYRATRTVELVKPCEADKNGDFEKEKAREHFWDVVDDGFPSERSVCCG